MEQERKTAFLAGDWIVEPELNSLRRDDVERHVEPKVMKVLLTLASREHHVFSKEELITTVWPDTFVSDDVLTRCISILRRITLDDAHAPIFIQTVPKMGYRLVVPISELPRVAEELAVLAPRGLELEADLVGPIEPKPTLKRRLAVGFLLVIVVVIVGIAWLLLARAKPARAPSSFRTVQFTSYAGEQTEPVFSPDGSRVAFVWIAESGASRHIYLKRIGSESADELSARDPGAKDQEQYSPTWSPDGRQIAYLAKSKEGLGIFVAQVGASAPAQRVFIPQEPSHWEQRALSWSPDGRSLVFADHAGSQPDSSIFELDVATERVHALTTPPPGWEGDLNPAWSPDGTRVAFTRASETAVRDIFWLSVADGSVHPLTHDRMNIDSLAWDRDGRSVVFSSNRGGKYGLWRVAVGRGAGISEPERLPVGTEDAYQPSVGPKPGQLAYSQGSAIWSIVRVRESGLKEEAVLSSTQQDSAPSVSPDGRFFAVQSLRSGSQEIWISSIQGDMLRQLTTIGGPVTGSPSWSNAGDRILFDSRPDGHSHIFVVPVAGGQPKQITFGDANDIVPRWSHDDRTVYFRSNRGGRWQLWRVSVPAGKPEPVTTGDGIEPQESADGRWLYYTRGGEAGIWRVPTAGGTEEQVLPGPMAGYWGYWQVTPLGIVYLAGLDTLRLFDPRSGQTRLYAKLSQAPPPFAGITATSALDVILMTSERDAGRHLTLVEAQP